MEKGEIVEIVNAFSYVGIVFTDRQTYSLFRLIHTIHRLNTNCI